MEDIRPCAAGRLTEALPRALISASDPG